ncbi:MAG: sigma-70 family RNA polymerase sigma factor, partial [Phycisphaerales bacterium]|nr:sigma-70 family RNA polymerase sigma factor [Phycisphaerales bacterium]
MNRMQNIDGGVPVGCGALDNETWEELCAYAAWRLRGLGIGDWGVAEDLVQDLAVRLLTPGDFRKYDRDRPLRPFLFGVLRQDIRARARIEQAYRRTIRVYVET